MNDDANVRKVTFYKAVRAIWGKSYLQFSPCSMFDQRNDTLYIPEFFVAGYSVHFATATLCRMVEKHEAVLDILSDEMRMRVERYLGGERAHLGPKTDAQRRKALRDRAKMQALCDGDEDSDRVKRPRGKEEFGQKNQQWHSHTWKAKSQYDWKESSSGAQSFASDQTNCKGKKTNYVSERR